MSGFLVSLLIVVLVLWLIRVVLDAVGLGEPANKILWIVSIVVAVLWLVSGNTNLL